VTRPTRTILRLTALLAAAAVFNYIVAWACVLCWPYEEGSISERRGAVQRLGLPADWDDPVALGEKRGLGFHEFEGLWQGYRDIGFNDPPRLNLYPGAGSDGVMFTGPQNVQLSTAGLPLQCLTHSSVELPARWESTGWTGGSSSNQPTYALAHAPRLTTGEVRELTHIPFIRGRFLPWNPIWLPFIINTLFYAALLAAPLYILPALRRHRRRRNAQCLKCGYPTRGLTTCPECATPASTTASVRPILACLAAALFALPTLGCSQPLNAHMSEMQILTRAVHEFPLGSSPQQVRLNCNRLNITLENDHVIDDAMWGRLPTGLPRPFYAATPTATLKFYFNSTPALKGFAVSKGIEP
jgi:hypothetical protein